MFFKQMCFNIFIQILYFVRKCKMLEVRQSLVAVGRAGSAGPRLWPVSTAQRERKGEGETPKHSGTQDFFLIYIF